MVPATFLHDLHLFSSLDCTQSLQAPTSLALSPSSHEHQTGYRRICRSSFPFRVFQSKQQLLLRRAWYRILWYIKPSLRWLIETELCVPIVFNSDPCELKVSRGTTHASITKLDFETDSGFQISMLVSSLRRCSAGPTIYHWLGGANSPNSPRIRSVRPISLSDRRGDTAALI